MRMRRKKHLEEKLAGCGDLLIIKESEELNFDAAGSGNEEMNPAEIFKNKNPTVLEVGAGKGMFAAQLAKLNPNINIIAVEKDSGICVDAVQTLRSAGVSNARVLKTRAEYLGRYLPENSIERIYLNFSCPYPKNTYAGHRLTAPRFLNIYKKLLKDGGGIYQKTDNMKLFEYSIESLSSNGFVLKNISLDLHHSDFEGNIETEYEKKFVSQGLPIYRLEAYIIK